MFHVKHFLAGPDRACKITVKTVFSKAQNRSRGTHEPVVE
jgi:hypothetical protein